MKMKIRDNHQQQSHQLMLVLVALLWFLPFAQAEHNNQHHLLDLDFHCQICHSGLDIESEKLCAKAYAFSFDNDDQQQRMVKDHQSEDHNKAYYTPRAPPTAVKTSI